MEKILGLKNAKAIQFLEKKMYQFTYKEHIQTKVFFNARSLIIL